MNKYISIASLIMFIGGGGRVFAQAQLGSDIDGEAGESGYSVSMNSDGDRVAIGAPYNDDGGGNAGQVRV